MQLILLTVELLWRLYTQWQWPHSLPSFDHLKSAPLPFRCEERHGLLHSSALNPCQLCPTYNCSICLLKHRFNKSYLIVAVFPPLEHSLWFSVTISQGLRWFLEGTKLSCFCYHLWFVNQLTASKTIMQGSYYFA